MMINGAVEVITASIVAGLTQHAALHPLDTLKVRLQYSKGVPMSTSVRGALGDALRDLELPAAPSLRPRGRARRSRAAGARRSSSTSSARRACCAGRR